MKTNNFNSTDPGSFRDPSGIIFWRDGKLFRQINNCYKEQYRAFINTGLKSKLVESGLIIPYREVDATGLDERAFLVIEPDLIPLISYPYEWSFGQIKDAALTTLRIHQSALENGMILKDASAYNIQFSSGKAIHIDTLSFDFYKDGEPWVAYAQFCKHFLAPLFLMVYTDIRLSQLLRVYIDGIPLDLASKLLKGKGGFAVKAHIHWHAKSVIKHGQDGATEVAGADGMPGKKVTNRITPVSKFKMMAMIEQLIGIVSKLELKNVVTEWGTYYSNTNYTDLAADNKKSIVTGYLSDISPGITWDFGANDGTYSRLALAGANGNKNFVAAFDIDPIAVERNYSVVKHSGENMLPLLLDLANPSPGIGFANKERSELSIRQRPDCILMLALIHHLTISNNLPFGLIAGWLATFCDNLIIEFVPKSDSQVQVLLATRDDIFHDYNESTFEAEFGKFFNIKEKKTLADSDRVLYLMHRRQV